MRDVSPNILLLSARKTKISTISSADTSSAPLAAAIIWCEGNAHRRTNSSKRAMDLDTELYPVGSRTCTAVSSIFEEGQVTEGTMRTNQAKRFHPAAFADKH